MAKQSNRGGNSRVRFIMLEAEGPEGDLVQIAQAIQNALRPPQPSTQRVLPPAAAGETAPSIARATMDAEPEEVDGAVAEEGGAAPQKPRTRGVRRPTVPQAFEFSDDATASWKAFVGDTKPDTDLDRYLMVAAWMRDHHNDDPVTAGHVFACYRLVDWPVRSRTLVLNCAKRRGGSSSIARSRANTRSLRLAWSASDN